MNILGKPLKCLKRPQLFDHSSGDFYGPGFNYEMLTELMNPVSDLRSHKHRLLINFLGMVTKYIDGRIQIHVCTAHQTCAYPLMPFLCKLDIFLDTVYSSSIQLISTIQMALLFMLTVSDKNRKEKHKDLYIFFADSSWVIWKKKFPITGDLL